MKQKTSILVLGINGMVGETIYTYLKQNPSLQVFGTQRKKKKTIYMLSVLSAKKDLESIYKSIKDIDYIINCIGDVKKDTHKSSLILINSLFPHIVEDVIQTKKTKLIHLSTDAVFNTLQKNANEKTIPSPNTLYGMSKLLGETTERNALTIRTSFLGYAQNRTSGFLNKIDAQEHKEACKNQTWSGCTPLQFAILCEQMISDKLFFQLKNISSVIHFAPLGSLSKYSITKTYLSLSSKRVLLHAKKGERITRSLTTCYFDKILLNLYTNQIKIALQEYKEFYSSAINV